MNLNEVLGNLVHMNEVQLEVCTELLANVIYERLRDQVSRSGLRYRKLTLE